MDGEVVQVPGYVKAQFECQRSQYLCTKLADVSEFIDGNLVLSVRSTTPEFAGYRVTFAAGGFTSFACSEGGTSGKDSRGCFKAKFSVPTSDEFVDIKIPFNTFSDMWSPATGEQTTACAEDADACPTADTLAHITMMEFWAEGVTGKVHLEVKSVSVESATGERAVLV